MPDLTDDSTPLLPAPESSRRIASSRVEDILIGELGTDGAGEFENNVIAREPVVSAETVLLPEDVGVAPVDPPEVDSTRELALALREELNASGTQVEWDLKTDSPNMVDAGIDAPNITGMRTRDAVLARAAAMEVVAAEREKGLNRWRDRTRCWWGQLKTLVRRCFPKRAVVLGAPPPRGTDAETVLDAEPGKRLPRLALVARVATSHLRDGSAVASRSLRMATDHAGSLLGRLGRAFDRRRLPIFIGTLFALLSIGTVMVFSASAKTSMQAPNVADPAHFLKKHLVFLGIGLLACLLTSRIPYGRYRRWVVPMGILTLLVLAAVLVPGIGTEYNGARRWIRFFGVGFQPSDGAKLAVVLIVAHIVVTRTHRQRASFMEGFLPPMAFIATTCGLILLEPDFGTCLFTGATGVIVMLVGGIRARLLLPVVALALPLLTLVVVLKFDHVKPRIEAFVNPYADPMGKGYQVRQSLIAMGSGGATGQGIGQSRQALSYLPEESTDFIFAILGEETGFLGTAGTLLAYLLLVMAGFRIARHARDRYGQLVAAGMTTLIGLQAAINMAVVTGSVPNKGIALPFISFGGSLTVFYLSACGVVMNIGLASLRARTMAVGDTPGEDATPIGGPPARCVHLDTQAAA